MGEPVFTGRTLLRFVVCLALSAGILATRSRMPGMADLGAIIPSAALAGAAIGVVWKREVECAITFAIVVAFFAVLNSPIRF